jgi:hypothetical protein
LLKLRSVYEFSRPIIGSKSQVTNDERNVHFPEFSHGAYRGVGSIRLVQFFVSAPGWLD